MSDRAKRITRDDLIGALIAGYSQTMDANNNNEEAMRMINAMADRVFEMIFDNDYEGDEG
jgi:hypothetical protein